MEAKPYAKYPGNHAYNIFKELNINTNYKKKLDTELEVNIYEIDTGLKNKLEYVNYAK